MSQYLKNVWKYSENMTIWYHFMCIHTKNVDSNTENILKVNIQDGWSFISIAPFSSFDGLKFTNFDDTTLSIIQLMIVWVSNGLRIGSWYKFLESSL